MSAPQQFELLPYSEARALVRRITRVQDAKGYADKAAALREYAARAKDRELCAWATEAQVRSQRRAGELLIEAKAENRRRARGQSHVTQGNMILPTLAELGVSRKEAMLWQRVARMAEDKF